MFVVADLWGQLPLGQPPPAFCNSNSGACISKILRTETVCCLLDTGFLGCLELWQWLSWTLCKSVAWVGSWYFQRAGESSEVLMVEFWLLSPGISTSSVQGAAELACRGRWPLLSGRFRAIFIDNSWATFSAAQRNARWIYLCDWGFKCGPTSETSFSLSWAVSLKVWFSS